MEKQKMTVIKTDIHALRKHFNEISKEEIEQNTKLEEIDGLTLLSQKVHIGSVEEFEHIEAMLNNFDRAIIENVDGLYKIDQYKECEGVNNKWFIQDGFRHILVNGNLYYYNVLPSISKNGKMHFKTNRSYSEKYLKLLSELTKEEYEERKEEIEKKLMKNTKLLSTVDPELDGFIVELIAVVKQKQLGA